MSDQHRDCAQVTHRTTTCNEIIQHLEARVKYLTKCNLALRRVYDAARRIEECDAGNEAVNNLWKVIEEVEEQLR